MGRKPAGVKSETMNTTRTSKPPLAGSIAYLLLGWPVMLIAFVMVVTFTALGISTAIIWIGIPILTFALLMARGFATMERHAQARLFGRETAALHYRQRQEGDSWFKAMFNVIADPQSWLDVLWVFVGFITCTFTWALAVTWVALCTGPVTGPISALLHELRVPLIETVGYVLQKDKSEHHVLILRGINMAAHLVGRLPDLLLEPYFLRVRHSLFLLASWHLPLPI